MESPLVVNQYPKISKDQILDIFKAAVPKNEFLLTLADFLPDIFSNDIVEPENFQQQPPDFNIADAILENIATPKPMRLVAQKRVYIPKSPFSASGYADEPTHRVWYYLDEGHNIQGPFTSLEMDFWFDSGFFFNELLIRIKENNDFVKLAHLFGKTEIIQVAKPALLTPMGGHMLIDQAPMSAGILTSEPMSSGKGPALEKKQSIYTFGFDPDDNLLKDGENTQETSAETPIKLKNEEETKSVEADEVKQPNICVNNTDLVEKEGEKDQEEKCKEIKDNKEAQEDASGQAKRSESNGQNSRHYLDVKQKEEKSLLSPSGYKKNQRGPESSKKKNSYVEVYEPKTSPCPDKSAKQQQDNRKNKGREQGQTMLQYVVKGEKKEEPEPVKEKREKNNNNNNKGGNSNNNNHAKKSKQDLNDRDNIAGTPGKKNQDMVIFVPKKKAEVTYTEKPKDTPEKIYVPKQQQHQYQHQPKEVNALNVLPNLQPGFFQRKESDTFEVLKATSEYYQTGAINSFPMQEDSRQSLPPGLQPGSGLEPAINGRNFMKKPKDRLRLTAHHQCDDYEKEQDRVVATSLGLLDLEEEAIVNKKPPAKSQFKTNSATPSPLIIDNQTVGKLYNFNEDLKYSSFSNQAENFPEKEC